MPTGFTAGILDGEIKTFSEFAKKCMRAFGATIHMRDEDIDKEYEERRPSDYHVEEYEKAEKALNEINSMDDNELIKLHLKELEVEKDRIVKSIEKANSDRSKLTDMANQITRWNPPTDEHTNFKNFMLDQIQKTIEFDCHTDYYERRLRNIDESLSSMNPSEIRSEKIQEIKEDILYHETEHAAELKRCRDSNKWAKDLIDSLPIE